MKELTADLDSKVVQALQNKVSIYEAEISELKELLTKKDEEIANLANSKDSITSEFEQVKNKCSELENKAIVFEKINTEMFDLKKTITLNENEISRLNAETEELKKKVEELSNMNNEIAKSLSEKEAKIKELSETIIEKEKAFDEQKNKLEEAQTELSALKPTVPTEYTSEERLVCPKCGAKGKDLKVEEDKSKILGYVGHSPMYGKTNVCKKCGEKF